MLDCELEQGLPEWIFCALPASLPACVHTVAAASDASTEITMAAFLGFTAHQREFQTTVPASSRNFTFLFCFVSINSNWVRYQKKKKKNSFKISLSKAHLSKIKQQTDTDGNLSEKQTAKKHKHSSKGRCLSYNSCLNMESKQCK